MTLPPTKPFRIHKEILESLAEEENKLEALELKYRQIYGKAVEFKQGHEILKMALLCIREARLLTEEQIRDNYPWVFEKDREGGGQVR